MPPTDSRNTTAFWNCVNPPSTSNDRARRNRLNFQSVWIQFISLTILYGIKTYSSVWTSFKPLTRSPDSNSAGRSSSFSSTHLSNRVWNEVRCSSLSFHELLALFISSIISRGCSLNKRAEVLKLSLVSH